MKQLYYFLVAIICLNWLPAHAQNWRPFRPNGDVHAFRGASPDTILTLRLDSTVRSGGDSVYYFNRIMRRASSFAWQKARNNQFGKLMGYNVAQRTYTLYWQGDPTPLSQDRLLVLKPFAAVGSSWGSAFSDYGVTTTLLSRGTSLIDGVMDSVTTFQTQMGATIVLSKNFGLVSAPKDLLFGVPITAPNFKMLTLARRPAPAGLSYYNPLTLLDLQPGDELGYEQTPYTASPFACSTGYTLYRILTRQITADSIAYTMQTQGRTVYSGAPGCSPAGVTFSSISVTRIAASRRTGEWRGNWNLRPLGSLLTYAYRVPGIAGANSVFIGLPIVPARYGTPCSGPAALLAEALYSALPSAGYYPGIDALGWQQAVGQAVGVIRQGEHQLIYTRRTINGTVQTCGSRANFATLLPTKAAQRAATFQLYPNPATESATLRLAGPARVGTTVQLLDNLGRVVQRQQLATSQTTVTLSLQGLAPGVYLVEVQVAGEAAQHLPLQHQQ